MKQPVVFEGDREKRMGRLSAARRVGHGSMAWSAIDGLRQPQDGAPEIRSRIAEISARMQRGIAAGTLGNAAGFEPEDARLTGGTRSLMRRMLGLNIATRKMPLAQQVLPAKRLA